MRLIGQICNRLQRASGRFGFGTASVRQLGVNVCATGGETGEIERERERTLRIGVGEEARGGTGREIAWKRDGGRGRERERKTETGRGMIAHEAQMCLKHRAALAMPSPNLYPPPPHPFRNPPSRLSGLASSRSVSRRHHRCVS